MSSKNEDVEEGTKILFDILTLGFIVIFFLIKLLIKGILYLCVFIAKNVKKNKENKKSNTIKFDKEASENDGNDDNSLNLKVPVKDIKKELNMFDKDIYNDDFREIIMARGEKYCEEDRVANIQCNNDTYSCTVTGTNDYDVSLTLENNINIKSASCTCPYYEENKDYCKHIFALLYKIKCSGNKRKLKDEFYKYHQMLLDEISDAKDELDEDDLIDDYTGKLRRIERNFANSSIEDDMLFNIIAIKNLIESFENDLEELYDDEENEEDEDDIEDDEVDSGNHISSLGMFLLGANIESKRRKKKKNNLEFTEEEMDFYDLSEEEKEKVRNEGWAPWSFEKDDDSEDEDYFYDEDDENDNF